MKRAISFLVIMVLIAGLLAGCTIKSSQENKEGNTTEQSTKVIENFNDSGYPIVNEKIKLTIFGCKEAIQGPWNEMHLFSELEKHTNIGFEFITPDSLSYKERKNLGFVTGELPDLYFGGNLTVDDEINYGSQGILIPLEELIDKYAPNLKKILDNDPNIKKSITTPDGHIYALPEIDNTPRQMTVKLWINNEWLNNVGKSMPSNVDEFFDVLTAFKEKDPNKNGKPDEIPLSSGFKLDELRPCLISAFGFAVAGTNWSHPFDIKNDKVVFIPMQDEYKEYIYYMKKLYENKLLDQDAISQTLQQLAAKGNAGILGTFASAGPFLIVKVADNNKHSAVPPLTSKVNSVKMWPKTAPVKKGAFAITKNNKHPKATMRMIDYLYSSEGSMLATFGIEGTDWRWTNNDKAEWERITPEGMNPEEYRGGKVTPECGTFLPTIRSADFIYKMGGSTGVLNAMINNNVDTVYVPYWKDAYPQVYFTTEEQKKINEIGSDLQNYIIQMEAKFIVGNESIDNWDKYIDTIKGLKVDEATKLYQDAYDRWKNVK